MLKNRKGLGLSLVCLLLVGCATTQPAPRDVLALNAEAMSAYHAEDWATARDAYERLVDADPDRALAWYRLGNLQSREDELDNAIESYQRALELQADYPEARHNLGLVMIRRGAEQLRQGRREMNRPALVAQSDRFLAYLLVDLIQTVDIAVECDCEQNTEGDE
ncbi:MAG: tetratricopeptide repeat protein [Ectothiorhodospiraceae bacterium]|nr:tetratricopeptide repeat protein [Paracoccaceae bacterium]MCH8505135.1 tetratricopeptide repeat protein [Ectothiorhodospiraceae bacterium]